MYKLKDEFALHRWPDTPILFFDFETTGLLEDDDEPESTDEQDVKDWIARNSGCHVVQVAADLYRWGSVVGAVYEFIRPSDDAALDIPAEATEVHGVTRAMIEAPGVRTFAQMWDDLAPLFGQCAVCVAYNGLGFDKKVLELELARITGKFRKLTVPLLDPMIWNKMKKMKNKKGKSRKSIRLLDAAKDRGCAHSRKIVNGEEKAHNAKVDIDMLRDVTIAMSVSDIHTYNLEDTLAQQMEWDEQLRAASTHERKKRKEQAAKKKVAAQTSLTDKQ